MTKEIRIPNDGNGCLECCPRHDSRTAKAGILTAQSADCQQAHPLIRDRFADLASREDLLAPRRACLGGGVIFHYLRSVSCEGPHRAGHRPIGWSRWMP